MYTALIALAVLTYIAYKVGCQISHGISAFLLTNEHNFKAMGTWAVITGATGGIGKAYARQMASRGLDIYLLGRSEEKLSALKEEMSQVYPGRRFRTLCVDFKNDTDIHSRIYDAIGELDVGVLINNAGCADDLPGLMHEMDVDLGLRMIHTNMSAVFLLSHCVLGGMQRRRRGAIINVSSFAALNICPMMSLYAATKTYIAFMTKSLESEYSQYNIQFQCLFPSFVQTNMAANLQDASQPNLLMPSPETYVKSALNAFGVTTFTTGYWFHSFFALVLYVMPCGMARKLGDQKMDEMIEFAKQRPSQKSPKLLTTAHSKAD